MNYHKSVSKLRNNYHFTVGADLIRPYAKRHMPSGGQTPPLQQNDSAI